MTSPTLSSTSTAGGYNVYEYIYSGLSNPVANSPLMFFATLPNTSAVNYYCLDPGMAFSAPSGTVVYSLRVVTTNSVGFALPEIYVFTLVNHKAATGFGVQVFNPSGALTFDSRNTPLGIISLTDFGLSTGNIYPYTGETPMSIGGPWDGSNKLAYLIPYYFADKHGRFGNTFQYAGGIRAVNNSFFYTSAMPVYDDGTPDSGASYQHDYTPNTNPVTWAIIRASRYD